MSLTSTTNWSGREVNGVVLGEPVVLDDGSFLWDGAGSGTIDDQGNVVSSAVGRLVVPSLAPEVVPVSALERDAGITKIIVTDDEVRATGAKGKVVDLDVVWAEPVVEVPAEVPAEPA